MTETTAQQAAERIEAAAIKMMKASWATGCDSSWAPAREEFRTVVLELLARQVPEWLPIDSAPKDGTRFLVYGIPVGEINDDLAPSPVIGIGEVLYGRNVSCPHSDAYSVSWRATHWAALPTPPSPTATDLDLVPVGDGSTQQCVVTGNSKPTNKS